MLASTLLTILNVCHLVYSLNEVVSMIKIGMTHSTFGQLDRSLLNPKFWIKDFTWTREGFCYTLNSSVRVGTRPVHKNLFLEFPKYPSRFMLHFDI